MNDAKIATLLNKYYAKYLKGLKIKNNMAKDVLNTIIKYDETDGLKGKTKSAVFGCCENKKHLNLENVTNLSLGCCVNKKLQSELANNEKLKVLNFQLNFNQKIYELPKNLKTLDFGVTSNFCKKIKSFPKKLNKLRFGDLFNQNLDSSLESAKKLKVLIFGAEFNQKLRNLGKMKELRVLKFDEAFNQKLENSPKKLKVLRLGYEFNRPLDDFLHGAKKLRVLKLDGEFNQPLKNLKKLKRLKTLKLGFNFREPFNNFLPGLKKLKVLSVMCGPHSSNLISVLADQLPEGLTVLKIDGSISNFLAPRKKLKVKTLKINSNWPLHLLKYIKGLKSLRVGRRFNRELNNLPKGLKVLKLESFNQKLTNLPDGLKKLKLGELFNQKLTNLPKGLKILKLGEIFNQKLKNLPNSLEVLQIGGSFKQSFKNIPKSLKVLKLGNHYTNGLEKLPESLEKIRLEKLNMKLFLKISPGLLRNKKIRVCVGNRNVKLKYLHKIALSIDKISEKMESIKVPRTIIQI